MTKATPAHAQRFAGVTSSFMPPNGSRFSCGRPRGSEFRPAAAARQLPDQRPPAVRLGTATQAGGRQLQPLVRPQKY